MPTTTGPAPIVVDARDLSDLTLERDGVVFVPGAIDPEHVARMKVAADFAYSLVEQELALLKADGTAPAAMMMSNAAPRGDNEPLARIVARDSASWGGIPVDHYVNLSKDGPDVSHTYAAAVAQATEAVRAATGLPMRLESSITYIRRPNKERRNQTFAPWHFDSLAAGTVAFDPVFNCWVPFVAVGRDCPSLEFMRGTHKLMRSGDFPARHPGYPTFDWLDANIRSGDDYIVVPLQPGDVAIFDHYTLHRTQMGADSEKVRTSCEMRFTGRPH